MMRAHSMDSVDKNTLGAVGTAAEIGTSQAAPATGGKAGSVSGAGARPQFEMLPRVVPISNPEELQILERVAASDNHRVIAPSHIVVKGGEIVGYGSIGQIPMVNVWLHSQRVKARESLALLNLAENIAALAGFKVICMPCAEDSPFLPFMERFGYESLGKSTFNLKKLG
jgi:hypothetical protein